MLIRLGVASMVLLIWSFLFLQMVGVFFPQVAQSFGDFFISEPLVMEPSSPTTGPKVLLEREVNTPAQPNWTDLPQYSSMVDSEQMQVHLSFGKPVIKPGTPQLNYLKIGLTGKGNRKGRKRPPVNLSIVLDRSGSMAGQKLDDAKKAAVSALERLQPDDIFSFVVYDSQANILIPARKFSEAGSFREIISGICPGGSTALFEGVCFGANEVKKNLSSGRTSRVILLSDGMANVGPQTPEELERLGQSLSREGITVTTLGLGLGYNENLMAKLACAGEGNHAFIEKSENLATVFDREFGDVLNVAAKEITLRVECRNMKPIRCLGRGGIIQGQTVVASLSQIYSDQQKYLMLEVEIPREGSQSAVPSAEVGITHMPFQGDERETLNGQIALKFCESESDVEKYKNNTTMGEAIRQMANVLYKEIIHLRDQGKVEEAKKTAMANIKSALTNYKSYSNMRVILGATEMYNMDCYNGMDQSNWEKTRKEMFKNYHSEVTQQNW